jgi:histidine triad (HIT) family protein
MSVPCVFCEIVRGAEPASVVWEDDLTMALLDHRQFHPGHTLVIPRQHLCDVRELDHKTGAALMDAVARRIFSARRATRSERKLNEER